MGGIVTSEWLRSLGLSWLKAWSTGIQSTAFLRQLVEARMKTGLG